MPVPLEFLKVSWKWESSGMSIISLRLMSETKKWDFISALVILIAIWTGLAFGIGWPIKIANSGRKLLLATNLNGRAELLKIPV